MSVSPAARPQPKGTERLLRDCALVGRVLDERRPPARERVEQELGDRLARQLVYGLRTRPQRDNGV